MKQKIESLSWTVKNFDINAQKIIDFDVLKCREGRIKKLKKQCATKEGFAKELRMDFQWNFWSRAEYELSITIDENNRIWLDPLFGCVSSKGIRIDVTDDDSYDWRGFATEHIGKQIYENKAKVDVFDQLMFANQFEKLVDYCWHTRLKYERKNPKFDK